MLISFNLCTANFIYGTHNCIRYFNHHLEHLELSFLSRLYKKKLSDTYKHKLENEYNRGPRLFICCGLSLYLLIYHLHLLTEQVIQNITTKIKNKIVC